MDPGTCAFVLALRDAGQKLPSLLLLVYGVFGLRDSTSQRLFGVNGDGLSNRDMDYYYSCYLRGPEDRTDERFDVAFERRGAQSRSWEMAVKWKGLCRQVEEWFHGQDPDHAPERYAAVMRESDCPDCGGQRLGRSQRHVLVGGMGLPDFTRQSVDEALQRIDELDRVLSDYRAPFKKPDSRKVRLKFASALPGSGSGGSL